MRRIFDVIFFVLASFDVDDFAGSLVLKRSIK